MPSPPMPSPPRPSLSPRRARIARVCSIVSNICAVLLLVLMGHAWMREPRTINLVIAGAMAFSLVMSLVMALHARRHATDKVTEGHE